MTQNYQDMTQMVQQILECVHERSPLASTLTTADIAKKYAGSTIRYSVYERWQKRRRTTPKQLFVDWFLYSLSEGYEDDIRKTMGQNTSESLSATTKSAFKRHKWVVECMLRCSTEYPPTIPDIPQERPEWEIKLQTMAAAALQQLRETLHLNEDQNIMQNTIVGSSEYRNKIIDERFNILLGMHLELVVLNCDIFIQRTVC
jgi:hypothetical protein